MIGFLSGNLHRKDEHRAVIDVNGVGYEVFLAKDTLYQLGETGSSVRFEIYTHVNENAFHLYGFKTLSEKMFFQKLISVSGVGPKLALQLLSAMPVRNLMQALIEGNLTVLTSISGVGKKTAERLVVELKDKFKEEGLGLPIPAANDDQDGDSKIRDVTSALMNLGYPETQARRIVQGLDINQADTVQSLIKKSLVKTQK